jgi:hypothetical protein
MVLTTTYRVCRDHADQSSSCIGCFLRSIYPRRRAVKLDHEKIPRGLLFSSTDHLLGLVSTFLGFTKSYGGLIAARFFLGLFEGGLLGGMVLSEAHHASAFLAIAPIPRSIADSVGKGTPGAILLRRSSERSFWWSTRYRSSAN